MLNHEKLICLDTGEELFDDGSVLDNPNAKNPALLRAVYFKKSLDVREDLPGIYQYSDWMPIQRVLEGSSAPVTYKSQGLAARLNLANLYITFNGYWPQKGATMTTGTFKECEAYSVCARMDLSAGKTLVVASAGNTARAFIKVCSENHIPLVVVVPEKNLADIWSVGPVASCVKLIAAGGESDYLDAITLSGIISSLPSFQNEGGAKNVARRDGMATTVTSAVTTIGQLPDYYFQAIGSGTGAIAAHECNLRFNESGAYMPKMMSLQVSQNAPFLPIYDAWKAGSRDIAPQSEAQTSAQIDGIIAKVLSNRKPPYAIKGGLYDALVASDGDVLAVTNDEARCAMRLFEETEGCSICPESGVALASLIHKVEEGTIDRSAVIMLNATGGGFDNIKRDFTVQLVEPVLIIGKDDFSKQIIENKISDIF